MERRSAQLDAIHWQEFAYRYTNERQITHDLDLEQHWQQYLDGEGKWWWARNPEENKARMRAALDSVRDYREAVAANDSRHDINSICDRNDELSDALSAAEDALLELPAPDLPALLWKLEMLLSIGTHDDSITSWSGDTVRPALADARRLLSGEA